MRQGNRTNHQLRSITITPHVLKQAEGSAEIQMGNTRVICTASVESTLPKWIRTPNMGWITAEYGMLPRSTHTRMRREKTANSSRSQEISRLIGRSLRSGVDLQKLGERQVHLDCDVIQADGGTRTASITGAFTALALALNALKEDSMIEHLSLTHYVAAVSVGVYKENILVDLCYEEDQKAEVDMNLVFSSTGHLIEIQGTAEHKPFSKKQLDEIINKAWTNCHILFKEQEKIIGSFLPLPELPKTL